MISREEEEKAKAAESVASRCEGTAQRNIGREGEGPGPRGARGTSHGSTWKTLGSSLEDIARLRYRTEVAAQYRYSTVSTSEAWTILILHPSALLAVGKLMHAAVSCLARPLAQDEMSESMRLHQRLPLGRWREKGWGFGNLILS